MAVPGDKRWDSLNLHEDIQKTLRDLKFETLTPVQAICIPKFREKKDLAVEAITGSGKTLAFIIPILEMLLELPTPKRHEIRALIISPTRELATQISEVLAQFLTNLPQFTQNVIIGVAKPAAALKKYEKLGGHIVISTPGRLAGLLDCKGSLFPGYLRTLEYLILDEADRLLQLGFEASLNTIFRNLPKQRRTGMFSATQTKELPDLLRAGLRNTESIVVKDKSFDTGLSQRTPASLSNYYMIVEPHLKFSVMVNFLRTRKKEKHILFVSTCASVNYFSALLKMVLKEVPLVSIHGKMGNKRQKIFQSFKHQKSGILLCTDVMARGIDIPDVNWVIQYDPPSSASAFVHRCGRTARQGNIGNALLLMLPNEDDYLKFLEINQKVNLEEKVCPTEEIMDLMPKLRIKSSLNRDLFEQGMRAFVSFVQAYSKHECNYIFRLKDLNFGKLAMGFGLLKLPKMPEIRKLDVSGFEEFNINTNEIPYLDKEKETERQANLLIKKETGHFPGKVPYQKPKRIKESKKPSSKRGNKRRAEVSLDEWEELKSESRLIKKLKTKKISKEEFDEEFKW